MWDLPRPGLKPVSPAWAGGFLTAASSGKPRKSFFLACFWRIILQGTEFWVGGFFSLNTLYISLHSLLACMVSEEKLDVILISVPLWVRCFILWLLSGLFLYLWFFCGLKMIYLVVVSLLCILLGVLWASSTCGLVSDINFRESLSHYCFKHFFCFFFSSLSGIAITYMLHIL